MSTPVRQKRLTPLRIQAMKGGGPIVCLAAYTTPMARLLDPHCDLLLVGDSLGMVVYGMETTISVTLDMMIAHGTAVTRGAAKACVVVDMPFGTYQESREVADRSAHPQVPAGGRNLGHAKLRTDHIVLPKRPSCATSTIICIYSFDPAGEIGQTQSLRIFESRDAIKYGKIEALDDAEIVRLNGSIQSLVSINRSFWDITERYGFPK